APVRPESCREEINGAGAGNDWSLLSIGTLGNEPEPPPAMPDQVPDFTIDEVKKLQEALNKLLRRAKSKSSARGSTAGSTAGAGDEDPNQLPLDRFLNCPSSLEVDRSLSLRLQGGGGQNGEFSPDTQIILTKARELLVGTNAGAGAIKQKSFKFLLKKMFACRGGFAPAPTLKDPVETRLEKLFKTMLQKKMSARPSNAASSSRKYYLEDKPMGKIRMDRFPDEDEDDNGEDDIFKWDKTDSDFIVLEV
ncbi:hypothetical protein BRADI_1g21555v3, partial [Brachypodium distachyon]